MKSWQNGLVSSSDILSYLETLHPKKKFSDEVELWLKALQWDCVSLCIIQVKSHGLYVKILFWHYLKKHIKVTVAGNSYIV